MIGIQATTIDLLETMMKRGLAACRTWSLELVIIQFHPVRFDTRAINSDHDKASCGKAARRKAGRKVCD